MYALVGDIVHAATLACQYRTYLVYVIISYNDDIGQYLVWCPSTHRYYWVPQILVTAVDRWSWYKSEEVEDVTSILDDYPGAGNRAIPQPA